MAQLGDGDLANQSFIIAQDDALIQYLGSAEGAGKARQGDSPPSRGGLTPDLAEHFFGAAPQSDERDVLAIEFVQMGIGGQARVKNQFRRQPTGASLPELHKTQNLIGLFGLGQSGVGVAEHSLGGIASQEDQDAFLAAAAAGNIVFFQGFLLGVGGNGVEIQVE